MNSYYSVQFLFDKKKIAKSICLDTSGNYVLPNLNQDNSYYLRVNLFLKITVTIAAPQIAITKTFIAILAVSPVLGASVFVVFLSAVSTFLFVLSFVLLLSFSTAGFTGVGFTGVV